MENNIMCDKMYKTAAASMRRTLTQGLASHMFPNHGLLSGGRKHYTFLTTSFIN